MKVNEAIKIAGTFLPEERMAHVLGVVETSEKLAIKYGVDVERASVAAALHDIAKCEKIDTLRDVLENRPELKSSYLEGSKAVWHAPVGAVYAKEKFGITDEDILNAIRFHTTGRAEMSELEKIIFVADFIEPGRTQLGADECRLYASINLNKAVAFECKCTIDFLKSKKSDIHLDTLETYEFYKGELD